ncbi:hypothetical protein HK102_011186, partial [Quaeritorhiza haematococci]
KGGKGRARSGSDAGLSGGPLSPAKKSKKGSIASPDKPPPRGGQSSATATTFPQARVKKIMKEDKEVVAVGTDAVFLVALATEKFVEMVSRKAYQFTKQDNRKGVSYKDLSKAIRDVDQLEFLSDVIPTPIPFKKALERKRAMEQGE